ncbi:MAG: permease [Alphaproteobacteria bacterium]|nr:permease [Alphaproteobacteria bacterium]
MAMATDMTMSTNEPTITEPKEQPWLRALLRRSFGRSFWGFVLFAIVSAAACYVIIGGQAFNEAVENDISMVLKTIPRIIAAMLVAGMIWVMLPRDRLTKMIGSESGMKGLVIAALAGIVTPGGPSAAFSLLAVLGGAGADRGAMVAYITSWSMLGFQRIIVWDVPMMGAEFSLTRFLVSLPLPIIAGMIARALPMRMVLADPIPIKGDKP